MRGVEVIWRILQDCDKKNNELVAPIIDLITKLYHNLSEEVHKDIVASIQDEFCRECLQQMRYGAANPRTSNEEKRLFIKTITAIMKSFLSDSERNGVAGLRNHAALERGEFVERVILVN